MGTAEVKVINSGIDEKMGQDAREAMDKFKSCKHNNSYYCYGEKSEGIWGRIIDSIFGIEKHEVGVHGYSVLNHCLNCKRYEKNE